MCAEAATVMPELADRRLAAAANTGSGGSATLPNALTTTINHERSPVLLTSEEECRTWLNGTPEEGVRPHPHLRSRAHTHRAATSPRELRSVADLLTK